MATHGFVVISPNSSSVNATLLKASLDWILAENDNAGSVYNQKLNTGKVAMGGHSLGSIGTFNVEATETRLTTTIHIAGGSFDGHGFVQGEDAHRVHLRRTNDIALPQCEVDFQNVRTQPTFYSELQGSTTSAPRAPRCPAWWPGCAGTSPARSNAKPMFTGPSGQFFTGIWKSQTKNW